MTDVLQTSGTNDPARDPDRLRLTGSRAPTEHVDGAWWPASRHLDVEIPALVTAIGDRMPRVAMVAYRRDGWIAPQRVQLGGRVVELLGFVSDEPSTIIVIGEDGHHLTLRVIDPDVDERQARLELDDIPRRAVTSGQGAAAARSVAEVASKLAEHEGRHDPIRDAQILSWCQDAAAQLDDARIQTFVPILVEHIVNNRMHRERHLPPG
jgi:Family of unknown function (DUF5994)